MGKSTARRSSLFLMELLIAILFFSLAAAVCIQLFAKAHLLTKETRTLNLAMNQAQNGAEIFSGTDGSLESLQTFYEDSQLKQDKLSIYYDENWNFSPGNLATYQMTVTLTGSTLQQGYITVTAVGEDVTLYELDIAKHVPLAVKEAL